MEEIAVNSDQKGHHFESDVEKQPSAFGMVSFGLYDHFGNFYLFVRLDVINSIRDTKLKALTELCAMVDI